MGYKVKKGDNLSKIANKLGMSVGKLMALNPGVGNYIRSGQTLRTRGKVSKGQAQAAINAYYQGEGYVPGFAQQAGVLPVPKIGGTPTPADQFKVTAVGAMPPTPGAESITPATMQFLSPAQLPAAGAPSLIGQQGAFGMPPTITRQMRARELAAPKYGGYLEAVEAGKQWWDKNKQAPRRPTTPRGAGQVPFQGSPGTWGRGPANLLYGLRQNLGAGIPPAQVSTAPRPKGLTAEGYTGGLAAAAAEAEKPGRVTLTSEGYDYRSYLDQQRKELQRRYTEWTEAHPGVHLQAEQEVTYNLLISGSKPWAVSPNAAKIANDEDWIAMGYYQDEYGYWRRLPNEGGGGGGMGFGGGGYYTGGSMGGGASRSLGSNNLSRSVTWRIGF